MKKITSLLLMLFVVFGLQAQTANVQGVPRQLAKSAKADPAVVYPNIDFDEIEYVVGSGKYLSALVIKWDDGKGGNCNLVWGYKWSTPDQGTGEAMLRAVAKADPRFYMLVYGNTQYGAAIGGMGFDLNGNGNIALLKGGVSYSLTDGIYGSSSYDFDSYTSNDPADHWHSGWMNGYWSYWTTSDVSKAYEYSQVGASSRNLAEGSIDGWSYVSDMSNWYSNDMSGTICYVNSPKSGNTLFPAPSNANLTVQGIPYHSNSTKSVKSEPAVVYPNIDFDEIEYVVGSGKYLSALVIKWDDGKGGNCNLVWGYKWSAPEQGTGEAMLRAVAKADPRFYMLVYGNTQYGAAIGGMGFDLNGNGNIALLKGGVSYPLTDGIYGSSSYDFDSYTSNDPADHWHSGWMNGYWSYWTTSDVSKAYDYSQVGASSRKLAEGSIDGWSFMSNMSDWYSNDMSGKVCYVSKPVTAAKASMAPQVNAAGSELAKEEFIRKFTERQKTNKSVVNTNVDFEDLDYIVGSGNYFSALVIKWSDGKDENRNLIWGYKWSTPEQGTGEAMLRAIAKADPRFYMLLHEAQGSVAVGGLGFDLNESGNVALAQGSKLCSLTNGIYSTSAYDMDSYTSVDATDHWRAGWVNGLWLHWFTKDNAKPYEYAGIADPKNKLNDGSVDGWSFISDFNDWDNCDMSGEVEYLSQFKKNAKSSLPQTRSRVLDGIVTVQTMDDFYKCIADATDGDTIQFEPNLRGTVVKDASVESHDIYGKNITLIGHGVIIEGGTGLFFDQINKCVISDFTFRNLNEGAQAIYVNSSNVLIEKCAFENINSTLDGVAIKLDEQQDDKDYTVNIHNCRFSNNTTSKQGIVSIKTENRDSRAHKLNVNIVSCTFEGNQSGTRGNSIAVINYPAVKIANCVFENDNKDNGLPTIGLSKPNKLPAEQFIMAYNLVEGSVSTPEDEIKRLSDTDYCAASFENDALTLANGEYLVVKNGLAYNRFPANTTIEGITMPDKDILGLAIDYSKATHTGACQQLFGTNTNVDYTKGTFVVNEDWFGHQNSTVNFLTDEGEWYYRIFQKENEGMELGATSNFGTVYGDKFYIVCKQDKDPGATITGGRLTVCDARTMKCLKQIQYISQKDGKSNADGRAFLGVNEHKGYISSSNGIYIFDIDNMEVKGQINGSGNPNGDQYGSLYLGQVGSMIRVNERVFAVHQSGGMMVIDAEADTVITVVKAPKEMVNGKETERGFGSVVLSKDGNLWLSVAANTTGSGATMPYIYKVDPATCDTTRINIPEGIYPPANSWYAWTADGFCASKQQNCLYWNGGDGSWFAGKNIIKYDIEANEFHKLVDFTDTEWTIYGACLRVDPVSDQIYVSLYHDFQDPTHVLFKYDNEGNKLAEYSMINNYWFPALPVFPDNEAPVMAPVSPVTRDNQQPFVISLAGLATDADNQDAAIVKSVERISDATVLAATIVNGDLKITPKGLKGNADVTLKINSNGKLTESMVAVELTKAGSGIDEEFVVRSVYSNGQMLFVNNCEGFTFGLYNANGQLIDHIQINNDCFSTAVTVPAGIYYLKGNNGKETTTFKVILN